MEELYFSELVVPLYQLVLFLAISTVGLLFHRVRLVLITNFLFVLYWGYWLNREVILGPGIPELNLFTCLYFGFGLVVAILSIVAFSSIPNK